MSENKTNESEFFREERLTVKFSNGDAYEAHQRGSEWDSSMLHTFFARLMHAMWDKEEIAVERKVVTRVERTEELP